MPKTAGARTTATASATLAPTVVADQRLLKCIADSSAGTNDHYFRANTATELPGIFAQIARQIAFRLVK